MLVHCLAILTKPEEAKSILCSELARFDMTESTYRTYLESTQVGDEFGSGIKTMARSSACGYIHMDPEASCCLSGCKSGARSSFSVKPSRW